MNDVKCVNGRWYRWNHHPSGGSWVALPCDPENKLGPTEGLLMLVNAMVTRAIWDYSHHRSCFLASGGWAVRTTSRFLFGRDEGSLESLSREMQLGLDVARIRDIAMRFRDLRDERYKAMRRRYKNQWQNEDRLRFKKSFTILQGGRCIDACDLLDKKVTERCFMSDRTANVANLSSIACE